MVTFDQFLSTALALPRAAERLTWESTVTLRVGEKIFAMGTPGTGAVTVKASRADQAELLAAEPEVYSSAPYVGRHGWVLVQLAGVDPDELRDLLTDAWRSVVPKKLVRDFEASGRSSETL
ncbi:MmcQ/YjbR family DNA-binding protein [Kitasatospora sp. CMC57]|uniref:MmcQ/YjbR family DNA-binding protein n=1 Tax=Kitasatospora sp. CMC57 TaxID=3231513 RepID=A0AB33K032_9ACTN